LQAEELTSISIEATLQCCVSRAQAAVDDVIVINDSASGGSAPAPTPTSPEMKMTWSWPRAAPRH
jgi:hypothetical protein